MGMNRTTVLKLEGSLESSSAPAPIAGVQEGATCREGPAG